MTPNVGRRAGRVPDDRLDSCAAALHVWTHLVASRVPLPIPRPPAADQSDFDDAGVPDPGLLLGRNARPAERVSSAAPIKEERPTGRGAPSRQPGKPAAGLLICTWQAKGVA